MPYFYHQFDTEIAFICFHHFFLSSCHLGTGVFVFSQVPPQVACRLIHTTTTSVLSSPDLANTCSLDIQPLLSPHQHLKMLKNLLPLTLCIPPVCLSFQSKEFLKTYLHLSLFQHNSPNHSYLSFLPTHSSNYCM